MTIPKYEATRYIVGKERSISVVIIKDSVFNLIPLLHACKEYMAAIDHLIKNIQSEELNKSAPVTLVDTREPLPYSRLHIQSPVEGAFLYSSSFEDLELSDDLASAIEFHEKNCNVSDYNPNNSDGLMIMSESSFGKLSRTNKFEQLV